MILTFLHFLIFVKNHLADFQALAHLKLRVLLRSERLRERLCVSGRQRNHGKQPLFF